MSVLQSLTLYGFAPWLEILLAVALELILGKGRFFHPRRWIEQFVRFLDDKIRLSFGRMRNPNHRRSAAVCLVAFPLGGFALGWLIPWAFFMLLGPLAASLCRIVLIWFVLSIRQPLWNSVVIFSSLKKGDKEKARRLLSRFSPKDTENLSEQGICRSVCESLALALSEGGLLPLLFASFGALARFPSSGSLNAALALAAVMLYALCACADREFDACPSYSLLLRQAGSWVCFFPARLSAALTMLSAWILRLNWKNSSAVVLTSAATQPFLCRGWSLGSFAGALNLRLGGGAYYRGQWRTQPSLGSDFSAPNAGLLKKAAFLTLLTFALATALVLLSPAISVVVALLAGSLGASGSRGFGQR